MPYYTLNIRSRYAYTSTYNKIANVGKKLNIGFVFSDLIKFNTGKNVYTHLYTRYYTYTHAERL